MPTEQPAAPQSTTAIESTPSVSLPPHHSTTPSRQTPSTRPTQEVTRPTRRPLPQRQTTPTRPSPPQRQSSPPLQTTTTQRQPPSARPPQPPRRKPVIVMAERVWPTTSPARPTGPPRRPPQGSPQPPRRPQGPPQRPTEPVGPPRRPLGPLQRPQQPREPEVITAPSLPRLPGQIPSEVRLPLPKRPLRIVTTGAPPQETSLGDSFAQNFGFDPSSIVYENDFRPVRQQGASPVLAFEVSSSDIQPVRVNPRPPVPHFRRRPAGPRTSGHVRFAHRHIEVDDNDDNNDNDYSISLNKGKLPNDVLEPVFHPSVPFSESLEPPPMPLPVPMVPVVPLLGGAASNSPLKPRNPPQKQHLPRRPNNPQQQLPGRPNRPPQPVGVNRLGRPQNMPQGRPQNMLQRRPQGRPQATPRPSIRRIISHVSLPDNHPIPVPQFVGPQALSPIIISLPVSKDGEDMVVAESAQVFTSDGTRLAPESLPTPPELTTRRRVTGASITNRPQVVPFRGELPPPIPDRVPHLPQFSPQTRPQSRKTTQQDDPRRRVAPGLLRHQGLSADIGQNRILAVSDFPTTAAAYAPTRPPTTPRTAASASEASNRTKLTILKDERRRRDATEPLSAADPPAEASVGAATRASPIPICSVLIALLALAR
ncbi:hypothetical protein C7M84_006977 [Penaeus vannamei]|uniref:Uncharacterized protein n=1 Tax=Penaeus vannamei TaxID=6689 RepID=A0A423TDG7_PENVA|nr:hypothetical protein C7M84_006977 [Penaeus vannamei]